MPLGLTSLEGPVILYTLTCPSLVPVNWFRQHGFQTKYTYTKPIILAVVKFSKSMYWLVIPGVGAGDDTLVKRSAGKLPGNVLTISFKKIWEVIKDQKDLNLPAHKVTVSLVSSETKACMRTCALYKMP